MDEKKPADDAAVRCSRGTTDHSPVNNERQPARGADLQPSSRFSLRWQLLAFGLVLIVGLAVTTWLLIARQRSDELNDARKVNAALAAAVAEHTGQALKAVDLVLLAMAEDVRDADLRSPASFARWTSSEAVHVVLRDRAQGLKQLGELSFVRDDGALSGTSIGWPPPSVKFVDEDFYHAAKARPQPERIVAHGTAAGAPRGPQVYMARRVNAQDGTFLGVALATIRISYFTEFFAALAGSDSRAIALRELDGWLLLRFPLDQRAGRDLGKLPVFEAIRNGAEQGGWQGPSTYDGIDRIRSAHRVHDFPLLVLVSQQVETVLASWWAQSKIIATAAGLCGLAFGATFVVLLRQVVQREATESRLRQREADLRRTEAEYRGLVEGSVQGIFRQTLGGRLLWANGAFARLHGFASVNELMEATGGKEFRWKADLAQREEFRATLQANGRIENFETEVRRLSDGELFWVSQTAWMMNDPHHSVLCYESIVLDISERKRSEAALARATAAEEANRVKTEFLANMSHELRTPLNAVIGFSEIIAAEVFGPCPLKYRDYAGDIRVSGAHLLGIVNGILDLAAIEAGRFKLTTKTVELSEVIAEVERMLEAQIANAQLHYVVELPRQPITLATDATRLRQVLLNILSNAVKFTPAGGEVRLTACLRGEKLELVVEDTGIGIAAKDIPIALAPFGQVDSALARKFEGVGLGLPIAVRVLGHLGGKLELSSDVGRGTCVRIALPITVQQGAMPQSSQAA